MLTTAGNHHPQISSQWWRCCRRGGGWNVLMSVGALSVPTQPQFARSRRTKRVEGVARGVRKTSVPLLVNLKAKWALNAVKVHVLACSLGNIAVELSLATSWMAFPWYTLTCQRQYRRKKHTDGQLTYRFITLQDTRSLKRHRRDVFYQQFESLFQEL
jgi:hypothetical protein